MVTEDYSKMLLWAAREQMALSRLAAVVEDEDERALFYRSNFSKTEGMRETIAVAYRMDEEAVRHDVDVVEGTLRELERERKAEEDAA